MFLLYFVLWIIFNGRVTTEIILFGIAIAAVMYWFVCHFMEYSPKTEFKIFKNFFLGICYVIILIWEIIKANICVMKLIYSSELEVEPVVVQFKTKLKTDAARVALANSITLTPGTITVTLTDNEYFVHCLDKELAEGIENSIFVKMLQKMEQN